MRRQQGFGLALGYEDLNDHQALLRDIAQYRLLLSSHYPDQDLFLMLTRKLVPG